MNLYAQLRNRAKLNKPIRVGVIGCGKFAAMFLAQAPRLPAIRIAGIADLDPVRALGVLEHIGWDAGRRAATFITDDAEALIARDLDIVVEATGDPRAGVDHALACLRRGRHVVMVNVEADVLAGPMLARRFREAGLIYSMAYGDQPALISEQVDWARACGFEVVCAGKGTKYLPEYHASTPETVWPYYGLSAEEAAAGRMNPKMFNSFLDGTKSAIEMAAVANACDLAPPPQGLAFPPCSRHDLADVLKPVADGGVLEASGTVEVVSSVERGGQSIAHDLRWGTYVTFAAPSDYARACFREYGLPTDTTGRYAALYRPVHMIGLELSISIASIALRGEPTGSTLDFRGDVVATAKRDLTAGTELDGEGGYCVYGRLMPARDSVARGGLPIGLAQHVTLVRDVPAGRMLTWSDVSEPPACSALALRRELESGTERTGENKLR